jgi:hypothetical protein
MKGRNTFFCFQLSLLILGFTSAGCSGMKLESVCGTNEKIKVTVLPFVNDNHFCNKNIEQKLTRMCYDVIDGIQLLNEFSQITNKSVNEISIVEFCDFVNLKGIDKIIIGDASLTWQEGSRRLEGVVQSKNVMNEQPQSRSLDEEMYRLVTGNYVQVNCYIIDTQSKERYQIFKNYKIKKIFDGTPSMIIY